jgi:hypothetical protein
MNPIGWSSMLRLTYTGCGKRGTDKVAEYSAFANLAATVRQRLATSATAFEVEGHNHPLRKPARFSPLAM